jgi:hypothetical protein
MFAASQKVSEQPRDPTEADLRLPAKRVSPSRFEVFN